MTSNAQTGRPTHAAAGTQQILNGLRQAWIETKISLRGGSLIAFFITPVITFGLVYFFGSPGDERAVEAARHVLPSFMAAGFMLGGLIGPAAELMQEREDGSMLRMKALPGGLRGYVVGKTLSYTIANLLPFVVTALIAAIIMPQYMPQTASGWIGAAGYAGLGLLSTIPLGVVTGALIKNAAMLMIPMFGTYGLLIISGIFFPISELPGWLQVLAQIFPMYWLGLGMRSAFLPPEAALMEIGESWRTAETLAVLGIWAAIGVILAPILMRRMIRGVSGSTMTAARERMLSQGY